MVTLSRRHITQGGKKRKGGGEGEVRKTVAQKCYVSNSDRSVSKKKGEMEEEGTGKSGNVTTRARPRNENVSQRNLSETRPNTRGVFLHAVRFCFPVLHVSVGKCTPLPPPPPIMQNSRTERAKEI